ncbi:MAG: putative inner membrane protein [Methanocella sp. PtaU1.Bin125]|nr:MAG: putative inner membrane protein [Methanocella sp. PtaU1.Bin125]
MRFLHWFIAGAFIGILNVLSYVVRKPLGVSSSFVTADAMGLKAAGSPAVEQNAFLKKHSNVDYQFILVIFMALGGMASALLFGRSRGRPMRSLTDVLMQLIGGFVMLFGARIGRGCTSGNILSGGAQMSLGSLLFAAATFLSGILTLRFMRCLR